MRYSFVARRDQYCEAIERMFLETDLQTHLGKIDSVDLTQPLRYSNASPQVCVSESKLEKGKDSKPNRDSEKPQVY